MNLKGKWYRHLNLRQRLVIPNASWRKQHISNLKNIGIFWPLLAAGALLLVTLFSSLIASYFTQFAKYNFLLHLFAALLVVFIVVIMLQRINTFLFEPLAHLRNWALRMRGGNLSVRIPETQKGEFAELARDINTLSDSLKTLSRQMDDEVRKQTDRIAQKSRSLQILHKVAENINQSRNLQDLMSRFLHTMKDVVHAEAAAVRLLDQNHQLELIASAGLEEAAIEKESLVDIGLCKCGEAIVRGNIQHQTIQECNLIMSCKLHKRADLDVIAVPLQHRGKNLGVYNLIVQDAELIGREDIRGLLTSIGQHIGVAVEKIRFENEAKRVAIMEERNFLAHELHDSLAQTLASLRFQVTLIDEKFRSNEINDDKLKLEITKLKNGLDQGNRELRELLSHFRARMDERGLIPTLKAMVKRFRQDTGVLAFFHSDMEVIQLPANYEVQVLHIVQEALSNARKHSEAQTVRVLLKGNPQGEYRVLIEDDGKGIADRVERGNPGEHIGLSIMRERAQHLSGELIIDSEPGEGTRIELQFTYRPKDNDKNFVSKK